MKLEEASTLKLPTKDLGELACVQVARVRTTGRRETRSISRPAYNDHVVDKFDMKRSASVSTPASVSLRIKEGECASTSGRFLPTGSLT